MHPLVEKNPRLKALCELDEKIGQELLGVSGFRKKKLLKLRDRVREEIRNTDIWEPIRAQMRKTQEEAHVDE